MNFVHDGAFTFPELSVVTTPNGRFYTTPQGNSYPSVTTVISKGTDQSWKDKWVKRVGEDEAKKISKIASRRGESVHEIIEKYLKNDPNYKQGKNIFDIQNFDDIKDILDSNIGNIEKLEVPLWSNFLRVAGRVDCIAQWNGTWSIVDFKTSKKQKTKDQVFHYMCQEAAYAYMFFEMTGKPISQIVTIITVDDDQPQVFVERTKSYLPHFIKIRESIEI